MPKRQVEPLVLPFQPDPGQMTWTQARLRHRVVCVVTGRRRGKTTGSKIDFWEKGGRKKGYYKAAYCAPTYKRSGTVYDEVCQDFKPMIARKRDSERIIEFRPWGLNEGAKWQFWSLEQHDNLRGEGLDDADLDECADIPEAAWISTIRPMLLERHGTVAFRGTPKRVGVGFVWFRRMFYFGQSGDPKYAEFKSYTGSSLDNPRLTQKDRDDLARDYEGRPDAWREEVLAEWLDEDGAVFEKLGQAFVLPFRQESNWAWVGREKKPGEKCLIGFDIASHEDSNIISVWSLASQEQLAVWRIRDEDYETVLDVVHQVRERFGHADIYADGNGLGSPIVARLARRYGDGVVDRKWTSNAVKADDVGDARLLFQRCAWKFLNVPWQETEFRNYTREKTANGLWRYQAPEGGYDDSVAAACMVAGRLKEPRAIVVPEKERLDFSFESGQAAASIDFWEKGLKRAKRLAKARRREHPGRVAAGV